jgi:hypothetical protein
VSQAARGLSFSTAQRATEDRHKAIAEALSGLASDAQVIGIAKAKERPSRPQYARRVNP